MKVNSHFNKPTVDEFDSWYQHYIELTGESNPQELLQSSKLKLFDIWQSTSEAWKNEPYAPQKWSPKSVYVHLADSTLIFANRLLWALRQGTNAMPGFDENQFANQANAESLPSSQIWTYMENTISIFEVLSNQVNAENINNKINANGHDISVRALIFINSGHFLHHLQVLQTRYGQE